MIPTSFICNIFDWFVRHVGVTFPSTNTAGLLPKKALKSAVLISTLAVICDQCSKRCDCATMDDEYNDYDVVLKLLGVRCSLRPCPGTGRHYQIMIDSLVNG